MYICPMAVILLILIGPIQTNRLLTFKNAKNYSKCKVSSKMYPYTQKTVLNLVSMIDIQQPVCILILLDFHIESLERKMHQEIPKYYIA